ncbi:Rv1733c family protein [Modestobacter sp. VKM Ac-2985]|uniref:Rv1733c family protein n=1 Tax=Modestobacter sp. VKM Ac-2985 TaxID=3004139 RepID=UPI0022AB5DC5|nr:hypothetical protein [Modestobacter sp. VKM Ac-2985]MCZ2839146.1 hypothetical protein [Modestobacter sp. VKM Ac-2985]
MPDQPGAPRRAPRPAARRSGPLVRPSDRIESASRFLAAVVLLLALPVALAVGTAFGAETAARAREQAAVLHQQEARLLEDAPRTASRSEVLTVPLPATWAAPDGTAREGVVLAPRDARAGDVVGIWTDRDGLQAHAPLGATDVGTVAAITGLFTLLGVALTAVGGHLLVCRSLWRRSAREWEEEWRTVEPRWSGRR